MKLGRTASPVLLESPERRDCVDLIYVILDGRDDQCGDVVVLIRKPSYGGRVVVPTKTGEAVPNSGRMEGTVATQRPANLKVFGGTSL